MQISIYLFKVVLALVFLITITLSSVTFAFSIVIKNETGVHLRIDALEGNCGKVFIQESNPLSIATGESIRFENVVPIVHHYRMCANGTCESSSLGMTLGVEEYVIVVTLKDQCICVKQKPLIWPGTFKCKEAQYEI
ncbi:MAG: hypothetical protein ABFS43_12640 [Thermodesulfobacteriota bacterium]